MNKYLQEELFSYQSLTYIIFSRVDMDYLLIINSIKSLSWKNG
jgi:hypothetical protein